MTANVVGRDWNWMVCVNTVRRGGLRDVDADLFSFFFFLCYPIRYPVYRWTDPDLGIAEI